MYFNNCTCIRLRHFVQDQIIRLVVLRHLLRHFTFSAKEKLLLCYKLELCKHFQSLQYGDIDQGLAMVCWSRMSKSLGPGWLQKTFEKIVKQWLWEKFLQHASLPVENHYEVFKIKAHILNFKGPFFEKIKAIFSFCNFYRQWQLPFLTEMWE